MTCPHFRGLNMYVDRVDGLEKYSAPNILGIRPCDWEMIKVRTVLFDSSGHILPTRWQKIVNSTSTNSNSTQAFTIAIETYSIKLDGGKFRTFRLATSDTTTYPIPATTFDVRFREYRFECSHIFTLEFPPSHDNSSGSSSSSSSNSDTNTDNNSDSNSRSSGNSGTVYDQHLMRQQWSLANSQIKQELVNNYLVSEIHSQSGSSNNRPVEIVVTFDNNSKGSLFYIKHKRDKGGKSVKAHMDVDNINENMLSSFTRRFSHELIRSMLETQGREDSHLKSAIANLAYQVYTLDKDACLKGLVLAKASNILRPLTVEETAALINLLQLSYRQLESLRRFVRHLQPNNTSILASRVKVAQLVRRQPSLLKFDSCSIKVMINNSQDDFTNIVTKYSYADMHESISYYLQTIAERENQSEPGISLLGKVCFPITIMGDSGGGSMSYIMLPTLYENDRQERAMSLGEFKGKENPELLKITQLPHIEEGIEDLNKYCVAFLLWGREDPNNKSNATMKLFQFDFCLVLREHMLFLTEDNSTAVFGHEYSSKEMPKGVTLNNRSIDNKVSMSFITKKRGGGLHSDLFLSAHYDFNRKCVPPDFSLKFIPFEFFCTGDLAFLMSIYGQHNLSHVRCLYCDLANSDKKNPRKAWQAQTSKGNLWTTEAILNSQRDVLLKGISLTHTIPPVLHIPMGIWTYILNILLIYIRDKIEVDLEEVATQKTLLMSLAGTIKGNQKKFDEYIKTLRVAKDSGAADRAAFEKQKQLIASCNTEMEKLASEIKNDKLKEKELVKKINKLKLERNNRPIERQLEDILHKFSISYKFFGVNFALTGDNCRRFAEHNGAIFKEVQEVILANMPSSNATTAGERAIFVSSIHSMFEKLKILAALFDTICTMMNQITELNSQDIEDFSIMCKVFGVFWRKCNLNVTPKVHIVESHLIDTMKRFGRVGLFNENPIERVHIQNKHWAGVLSSFKSWEKLVELRNKRESLRMIASVHLALKGYSEFHMRGSSKNRREICHTHLSYEEIKAKIEDFNTCGDDIDYQFANDMPVHDMEGLEEVDPAV